MKIDQILLKKILTAISDISDGSLNFSLNYMIDQFPDIFNSYSPETIKYHGKYLYDAGYLKSNDDLFYIMGPTPSGHAYLK